ncbi:MAG: valine--tRNA ligase [Anaerolineae bacterium]|nr:MAG: valine--tRNA ligase [Anaerolineae bacterium]
MEKSLELEEMAKTFDPGAIEARIYEFWQSEGFFAPQDDGEKKPFVITTPPPNVTGELHMGHALCYLVQDIMGRWRRMQGHPTLLLPGYDHAGIGLQNVVEKELAAEGLSRQDLGRETFERRCWEWQDRYAPRIIEQFQRLGFSFDWSRLCFTLAPGYARAVRTAFLHYYRRGLIYRGWRVVNWCPRCSSSISDLEVEHVEQEAKIYTLRYPLVGGGHIDVATTRPETMLGDTAVAVNPADARYRSLVGGEAILPLVGRRIPIVADDEVAISFGTGAVKVTPAHDPLDFEIGQRHELDKPIVIGEDGRMTAEAGRFARLTREACRQAVLAALQEQGLLLQIEPYRHSVGTCERCHTVIEPLLSRQWFMRMGELAKPAIAAVRQGRVRFVPERWGRVYLHWMENIRDWCISRQLWWGHRLPVWICAACEQHTVTEGSPDACEHCGSSDLSQEPDVLDTWFSSALWPFASLGWPNETDDLGRFYPTSFMVTAGEIVFLWIARMIVSGLEYRNQEPFPTVYVNPTVLNEEGRRQSKSLGTGVDPVETVEAYGADAARFALAAGCGEAQTMRFSSDRLAQGRAFANKVWQATRYVLGAVRGTTVPSEPPVTEGLPLAERWILSRLGGAIQAAEETFDAFRFDLAAQAIYDFFWGQFCDWYIEMAKIRLRTGTQDERQEVRRTLLRALEGSLRLLHPLMPFVTEALWQRLPWPDGGRPAPVLIAAPWPTLPPPDPQAEADVASLIGLVQAIRTARAEHAVKPGSRIAAQIAAGDRYALLQAHRPLLADLAWLDAAQLQVAETLTRPPDRAVALVAAGVEVYLSLAEAADLKVERERLERELAQLNERMAHSRRLLSDEGFLTKAPAAVVAGEQRRLAELEEQVAKLEERIGRLGGW